MDGASRMNLIQSNAATMSSREIAELTGKRHDNVVQLIRKLEIDQILTPEFQEIELKGRFLPCYLLGKRDSMVLVARLSPEFTAAIVDRWQELESNQAPAIPQTYAAALIEAGRLAQLAEEQAEQLAIAAPKVAFVEKYVESTGNKGFREVAKLLKIKEPVLRAFLSDNKIMYQLGGNWTAYQNHIDAGRFHVSTGTKNEHAYNTAKFTPKGIAWIIELIDSLNLSKQ